MNRAMFSGVAGLKAHQTKMDVIGNNIANVNTYGYKSQRAVFSDIYYQTLRAASAGNANRGGTNPSTVGYGSTLAAVQTQMTQSSMQNTGFGLDVAITGEGFLQVMDADGNIFYTKAGLLDYDSNGYLTDINGNFVLGSTTVDGEPGTQRIRLTNVGTVQPQRPSAEITLNGVQYTITASNSTRYGNVSLAIGSSDDLPAGQKAEATISSTGAITVQLNAFEQFSSMQELNDAINQAITEANGGVQHPAGTFTITPSENVFGVDPTDATWTGSATNIAPGLTSDGSFFGGALSITNFTSSQPGQVTAGPVQFNVSTSDGGQNYTITATVGGETFTGTIASNAGLNSEITLASGTGSGSITLAVTNSTDLAAQLATAVGTPPEATATVGSSFLGGASITQISPNIDVAGRIVFNCTSYSAGTIGLTATVGGTVFTGSGTVGGNVVLTDPSGRTITLSIPDEATMQANLGTTVDQTSLNGSANNHTYNIIAASAGSTEPLTGEQIAGVDFGVETGTIEGMEDSVFGGRMTFIRASSDFDGSGQITSDNFKATYTAANGDTPAFWTVTMTVGGKDYTTTINEDTAASSLLLKSDEGDYVQVTNPGFNGMAEAYAELYPGTDLQDGATMDALTGGDTLTANPSIPSRDLGLSSEVFTLSGGTEGGAVDLSDLTNIAIGSDGTVTVSHAALGTVAVGKISLATFANTSGLQASGSNYFVQTLNSGEPQLADPGTDGTGALKSSALEMSNVDLSNEMAEMITTQRGFQANSRIITVSDTMLEELINLKR